MALLAKRTPSQATTSRGEMQRLPLWDPFEVMRDFSPLFFQGETEFFPTFDVKEKKDAYIFKGDLPGMKEDDIEISLSGNRLSICGKREEEAKEEGDQYYAHERTYGSFMRTFTLPEDVDADKCQAEFKDGVLKVVVPKKPEAQPKKIALKGGKTVEGKSAKA